MDRVPRPVRGHGLASAFFASLVALSLMTGLGSAAATDGRTESSCSRRSSSTLFETRMVRIFAMAKESVKLPGENRPGLSAGQSSSA